MSEPCPRCPSLEAQIAALQARCSMLEQRVLLLHDVLTHALGAIRNLILFIAMQQEEPSMPRGKVLPTVYARLLTLLEEAQGRL